MSHNVIIISCSTCGRKIRQLKKDLGVVLRRICPDCGTVVSATTSGEIARTGIV